MVVKRVFSCPYLLKASLFPAVKGEAKQAAHEVSENILLPPLKAVCELAFGCVASPLSLRHSATFGESHEGVRFLGPLSRSVAFFCLRADDVVRLTNFPPFLESPAERIFFDRRGRAALQPAAPRRHSSFLRRFPRFRRRAAVVRTPGRPVVPTARHRIGTTPTRSHRPGGVTCKVTPLGRRRRPRLSGYWYRPARRRGCSRCQTARYGPCVNVARYEPSSSAGPSDMTCPTCAILLTARRREGQNDRTSNAP